MTQSFLLGIWMRARAAALLLVMVAGLGLWPESAWATHIRAGDIQAKVDTTANPNPRRVFFKLTLYTDASSSIPEDKETVFFGDGTSSCLGGVVRDGGPRTVPGNSDTVLNFYYFEHTYPTAGSFTVQFIGENRVDNVLNMSNSVALSFYISTRIKLDPALGLNHSPILRAPAIDRGAVGQIFLHNPAAFDADGDSLSYKLQACQYNPLYANALVGAPSCTGPGNNTPTPLPCTNFRLPNNPSVTPGITPYQVPITTPPVPATFIMDAITGQITWNAPVRVGFYNVAFRVIEWRRTLLGRDSIGSVVRDMQIIVSATANLRPTLIIPEDICVIAGQPVTGIVTATDGTSPASPTQTPITLFAYSGILPPATFRQTLTGPPTASGTFTWQTQCNNVARLPYQVVFKAQDNPNPVTPTNPPLIDEKVWRITVVGPPPQNLQAVADGSTGLNRALLSWNTYLCSNASRIRIYRKEGPSGFAPGPCDTGIPASAGYTFLASVPVTATSYIDNNPNSSGANQGLELGKTYCYRIYAEFPLPAGGASIASLETCLTIAGRAAQLTNVDVDATSTTAGQITVRWTRPRPATGTVFDGTPSYVLSRGEGLAPATFTTVRTTTNLADTSFVNTGLNTQAIQYTYKLEFTRTFTNGQPAVTTASTASSVRLSVAPANPPTAFNVSWAYQVPWDNTAGPVVIYRRSSAPGSAFVQLATATTGATGGSYRDADPTLVQGQTYCYYVRTEGRYTPTGFLSSLLNKSQEQCAALISPPCTPVLALQVTNCDSLGSLPEFPGLDQRYTNRLGWRVGSLPAGCNATISSYQVFYRPTPTGPFTLIGTTTQTSFLHTNLAFSGGCYAVRALAPSGLASDTSNVACQDNCVFFRLPNIYTPNGDGTNDVFRPKNNSPVRSIHFKAFNRWGVKVFENTTTANDRVLINWDGGGAVGETGVSAKVADGIYFYLAEVEFADFSNTKRIYKGWVEIVR